MEKLNELLSVIEDEGVRNDVIESIKKEIPKHFVAKNDFNSKNEELKATKSKLDEMQSNLENLNKSIGDADKLKVEFEKLTNEYETFKLEADKRVQNLHKKTVIEKELTKANANPDALDLLVAQFNLDDVQLGEDGNITNIIELVNSVKETRKGLFAEASIEGDKPVIGNTADTNTYKARYEAAVKSGDRVSAIKIKNEAFANGESI